ncbi:DEKNAAC105147 [Brettanomyces naardenensis]|uniref:DEKNAAC105148 n=1 Tax=Brettanomyces naardenensis TaxID=13370 RepID=A0A448YT17_BRENA|nr:DEKNAAC105147 [Brettanomyces naardenensis]
MKFLGTKVYRFPLVKFYWPFFVGAGLTYWLIGKAQVGLSNTADYINDPRHPRFKKGEIEQK